LLSSRMTLCWMSRSTAAAVVDALARVDAAGLEEAMSKILKYDILQPAGYVPR